jgi:hypothetical protein
MNNAAESRTVVGRRAIPGCLVVGLVLTLAAILAGCTGTTVYLQQLSVDGLLPGQTIRVDHGSDSPAITVAGGMQYNRDHVNADNGDHSPVNAQGIVDLRYLGNGYYEQVSATNTYPYKGYNVSWAGPKYSFYANAEFDIFKHLLVFGGARCAYDDPANHFAVGLGLGAHAHNSIVGGVLTYSAEFNRVEYRAHLLEDSYSYSGDIIRDSVSAGAKSVTINSLNLTVNSMQEYLFVKGFASIGADYVRLYNYQQHLGDISSGPFSDARAVDCVFVNFHAGVFKEFGGYTVLCGLGGRNLPGFKRTSSAYYPEAIFQLSYTFTLPKN